MAIYQAALRQAIILEAESWLNTPFHHMGRIKGVGVDCAQFLIAAYAGAGVIADFSPLPYAFQWHLNRSEERFLEIIKLLGGAEIEDSPKPGDVAIWKVGRAYSHGAIVVDWPRIIHAAVPPVGKVIYDNALKSTLHLERLPVKFFRRWPA